MNSKDTCLFVFRKITSESCCHDNTTHMRICYNNTTHVRICHNNTTHERIYHNNTTHVHLAVSLAHEHLPDSTPTFLSSASLNFCDVFCKVGWRWQGSPQVWSSFSASSKPVWRSVKCELKTRRKYLHLNKSCDCTWCLPSSCNPM